ncbi:bacterial transcriptional activator domain-containing protein [Arthrobacter sp. DNA4]|uniref:bacterial transcriptional activator domain-containing protein n=1 Tax=Arthrobacter sp. DNA4 TaxID=2963432 RepID=UPI0020CBA51D|nr:bacterial transcriptional activator domain-containing protein [Arthrobacter sp. DNA4]UTT71510.1 bacterial transcriptional activator domain-containing protein [Arthrobacter sp. DNA4]
MNDGPVLSLSGSVDVDLHRLSSRIRAARESPMMVQDDLLVLRACRHASLLPGWYEDWALFEQERLRQDLLHALTVISRKCLVAGDLERGVQAAEAALEIEPLYEEAVRELIAAELNRGNTFAALRTYERFRWRLEEELGLVPSESIRALIADKTRGRPVPVRGN